MNRFLGVCSMFQLDPTSSSLVIVELFIWFTEQRFGLKKPQLTL